MEILRSYWYYWYTGQRQIALASMGLTFLILTLGMVGLGGYSFWGVLIAVILDVSGLWLALIYVAALRVFVPDLLLEQADQLVWQQFVLPVIVAFIVSRLVTFAVMRFGRINDGRWLRWVSAGLASSLVLLPLSLVAKDYFFPPPPPEPMVNVEKLKQQTGQALLDVQQASMEATEEAKVLVNQAAQATQVAVDEAAIATGKAVDEVAKATEAATEDAKVLADKAAVATGQAVDEVAKATEAATEEAKVLADKAAVATGQAVDEVAKATEAATEDAKQSINAACRSIAESLGKNPDDYCKKE